MRFAIQNTLAAMLAGAACAAIGGWALMPGAAEAALLTSGAPMPPFGGHVCANVAGNTLSPAYIQNELCHGGSNQDFVLIGTTIYTESGQRCMDVQGNGNGGATGTPVDSYSCTGSQNQQWYYYMGRIVNIQYGLCLDATKETNGTTLVMNTCNGSNSQQWQIK